MTLLTSLRALGIALAITGLLFSISPAAAGFGLGICVIGLSLCVTYLGVKRGWRYLSIAPLVMGLLVGGLLIKSGVEHEKRFTERARMAKAHADIRALVSAVKDYRGHVGALPGSLAVLALPAANSRGQAAGPFMPAIPTPPSDWSAYAYAIKPDGQFTITTSGPRGTVVGSPEGVDATPRPK